MFAVVESIECRRVLEATVRGTSAVMEMVAARWRRSWTVVRGTPALRQIRWKWLRTYSGWRGLPPGRWKTRSPRGEGWRGSGWSAARRCRRAVATRGEMAIVLAAAGLGCGEGEAVVVDGREGAADEEHALGKMHVAPGEAEGFAFAHAGADEDIDQVGHERVGGMAVAQEPRGFVEGPDAAFGRGWSGDDGGACGVVAEAVVFDCVAEGELGVDEAGDVGVAEVVGPDLAEGWDEVGGDVVAIRDHRGGLQDQCLGRQAMRWGSRQRSASGPRRTRRLHLPASVAVRRWLLPGWGSRRGGQCGVGTTAKVRVP